MTDEERSALEAILGYSFQRPEWLEQALTHRSRREGCSGAGMDNESLEFLGDRVLGLVVSERLCEHFPDWDAGKLSKALARLVNTSSVYEVARELGLGGYLRLGRGEEKTGGREKQRLLADAYEAVVAAIYLDGWLPAASAFIERTLLVPAMTMQEGLLHRPDHKSALQEWLQQRGMGPVEYRVRRESGPDHRKTFEVEARLEGRKLAVSEGHSKKEAEQLAAQQALEMLEREGITT
jgi:ribonuclease-3